MRLNPQDSIVRNRSLKVMDKQKRLNAKEQNVSTEKLVVSNKAKPEVTSPKMFFNQSKQTECTNVDKSDAHPREGKKKSKFVHCPSSLAVRFVPFLIILNGN